MSTNIKLSEAQISKLIQSGGSFGSWLGNLGKISLTNIAIPLGRDNLPGLVSNLTSNAINKFARKLNGKGAVRAGKRFTLFVLNEDVNDIIKIIKLLEDLGVLFDGVTETVKHEKKTRRQNYLEYKTESVYDSKQMHWILLLIDRNTAAYFDSFGNVLLKKYKQKQR